MIKTVKSGLQCLTAFLASAAISHASITFSIGAAELRDDEGAVAPTSTLYLLIADITGDGFGSVDGTINRIQNGAPLGVGSLIDNMGLLVLHRGDLSGAGPGFAFDSVTLDLGSGWEENDALALLWFPTLSPASTHTLAGDPYGFYTDPTGIDFSDPWFTPADGSSDYTLNFVTVSQGGSNPDSTGNASLAVIPEPAIAAVLGGLFVLGLAVWRRRNGASA